jgi:hypothetical protein
LNRLNSPPKRERRSLGMFSGSFRESRLYPLTLSAGALTSPKTSQDCGLTHFGEPTRRPPSSGVASARLIRSQGFWMGNAEQMVATDTYAGHHDVQKLDEGIRGTGSRRPGVSVAPTSNASAESLSRFHGRAKNFPAIHQNRRNTGAAFPPATLQKRIPTSLPGMRAKIANPINDKTETIW